MEGPLEEAKRRGERDKAEGVEGGVGTGAEVVGIGKGGEGLK
jgi:hypothetical protein